MITFKALENFFIKKTLLRTSLIPQQNIIFSQRIGIFWARRIIIFIGLIFIFLGIELSNLVSA